MPYFGTSSSDRLATCDELLQRLFKEVVLYYDCSVLCGTRDEADQDAAYHEGRSQVQYPDSKHNSLPSRAVDVAPYPIDWSDTKRFYHFIGFVTATAISMNIEIVSGGDWDSDMDLNDQTFMDLVHFELKDTSNGS